MVTLQPEWDGNTWREIGKTENGVVVVTSHLYEGIKSWPLDRELYQKADSLPQGKADPEFKKKPEITLELINRTLERGYRPGIVLSDVGMAIIQLFYNR